MIQMVTRLEELCCRSNITHTSANQIQNQTRKNCCVNKLIHIFFTTPYVLLCQQYILLVVLKQFVVSQIFTSSSADMDLDCLASVSFIYLLMDFSFGILYTFIFIFLYYFFLFFQLYFFYIANIKHRVYGNIEKADC